MPMLSRFELLSKSFAEALVSSSLATLNLESVERPTFGHENLKKIAAAEQMKLKLKQEVSKETGSSGSAGPRKRSQRGVNSKRSTMKSDKKRRRRSTKNNATSNTTTNAKRNVSTSTTRNKRVKAAPTRRRKKNNNNVLGQYPCSHGCGKICLSGAGLVMHERACSGVDRSRPRSRSRSRIRKRGTTKNKEEQEKVKRRKME